MYFLTFLLPFLASKGVYKIYLCHVYWPTNGKSLPFSGRQTTYEQDTLFAPLLGSPP